MLSIVILHMCDLYFLDEILIIDFS